MPKRDVEREVKELAAVTDQELLRKALRDRVNLVVAKAADRIGTLRLRDLMPDLLKAYDRQFAPEAKTEKAKTDPQCWAKAAIAKALKDLDWTESEPFLRGAEYRQWEPVWQGEADSAGTLRATCLLAIPQCVDLLRDQKLWVLMRGFADKLAPVRLEAARGLEVIGGFEAALLLRLKARTRDSDLSVTGQVFESLIAVEQEPALSFVLEAIEQRGEDERDEELAEQAALALAASRLPGSTTILIACAKNPRLLRLYEAVLRALSISRLEPALDFLLDIIRDGRERDARSALAALELHRSSAELAARVEQAVRERESAPVTEEWRRLFPAS